MKTMILVWQDGTTVELPMHNKIMDLGWVQEFVNGWVEVIYHDGACALVKDDRHGEEFNMNASLHLDRDIFGNVALVPIDMMD